MKLNISESIRRLRREADMTQEEVATALGVTYQAVSRWENGQSYPDIELLPSLAALFGVDMDRLFGIDDDNMEALFDKYYREEDALESLDEKIEHAKGYIDAFPGEVGFRALLLGLYLLKGREFTDKHLPEMRRLCRYVVDHTQPGHWARSGAIFDMVRMEDDENVDTWLAFLNRDSTYTPGFVLAARYDYRDEVEKYNYQIQKDLYKSFAMCFFQNICKRDRVTYKNARSQVDGAHMSLRIIDLLRDPSTDEDAWLWDRLCMYLMLAAGHFGCGEIEAGYEALDRCVELCEIYSHIPEGTELSFNTPVLDEFKISSDGAPCINGYILDSLIREDRDGHAFYDWFDCVRDEERYKQIVAKVTRIYEEMAAKEA